MNSSKAHERGGQALLGSAFAFSLMTVCVKKLEGEIPIEEILFARSVFSIICTYYLIRRKGISPWGENKTLLFVRGLLGTGALICVFYALQTLPLSSSTVIQYTYPTFTAIAAWLFLGEKIRRRVFLAVVLGWVGIILVVQPEQIGIGTNNLPIIPSCIGLLGALLTALAYTCVRKLSKSEDNLVIIYYFPLVSILFTLPFMIHHAVFPKGMEWSWLLGIGMFTQLGQILITKGLSVLPAGRASAINYGQVLFANIWGILLFKESLNSLFILGSLSIMLATFISLSRSISSNTKVCLIAKTK